MMNDLRVNESVALSSASRRGLGGIRHIEESQLLLQEKVINVTIEAEKVKGINN